MIASATKRPIALSRLRAVPVRRVRGRFDSAATTEDNRRHWANADALSADAAASAAVRRTLRNRARYEVANNSYARGIVLTLANDTIGTGPRLQMLTDSDEANNEIEHEFDRWAREVSLAEKLRTMRMARAQDGEAFGMLVNNPVLDHPVKLDLRLIEADHVTSPDAYLLNRREVDGIVLDGFGNPVAYHVLKHHPGNTAWGFNDEYRTVPASHMIHVFRQDRPGQHRGIPEITPALPLFAQLRRFTLAVLGAAEAAADFAGILYTDAPAGGEAEQVEPMDLVELERNMLLTMPGGWKMSQMQAEQPATTYAEFKREILNEIARCLNMPFKVGARKTRLSATTPVAPRRRDFSAIPRDGEHHRVFGVLGVATPHDLQVILGSPSRRRSRSFEIALRTRCPALRSSSPETPRLALVSMPSTARCTSASEHARLTGLASSQNSRLTWVSRPR